MAKVMDAMELTARSRIYAFLAQGFSDPSTETLAWLKQALPAAEVAIATIGGTKSGAEFAALRYEIAGLHEGEFAATYHRVFGHGVSGDCPPYEGEYGHPHIFQKTQSLADNAGFLAAFGLGPAPGLADRLDHISVELEFMHVLAAKEAYALTHEHGAERLAIVRGATRKYLKDHLGRWAPAFAARLEAKAQDGPYAALARLLAAFIAEETHTLDVAPAMTDLSLSEPQAVDEPAACQGCAAATVFTPATRGMS